MAPSSTSPLAVAPPPSSARFRIEATPPGPPSPAAAASASRWPTPAKLPPARPRVALLGAPPHLPIANELLRKARSRHWIVLTDHLHSTGLAHDGRLDGLLAFSVAAADASGLARLAGTPCVTIALGDESSPAGFGVIDRKSVV